jgi:hypothetical protein
MGNTGDPFNIGTYVNFHILGTFDHVNMEFHRIVAQYDCKKKFGHFI